jgi:hypothetical protein
MVMNGSESISFSLENTDGSSGDKTRRKPGRLRGMAAVALVLAGAGGGAMLIGGGSEAENESSRTPTAQASVERAIRNVVNDGKVDPADALEVVKVIGNQADDLRDEDASTPAEANTGVKRALQLAADEFADTRDASGDTSDDALNAAGTISAAQRVADGELGAHTEVDGAELESIGLPPDADALAPLHPAELE